MNVMPMKNALTHVGKVVEQKSPAILTGIGIGSFVGCAVLAVKATPKAILMLDMKTQEKYIDAMNDSSQDPSEYETYEEWLGIDEQRIIQPSVYFSALTPVEVVKATWKAYIPSVGLAVVGIACLIASAKVSSARNAAFAGAASIAEKALYEYQQKVIDILGEDKAHEIRDQIAKDRVHKIDVLQEPGVENEVVCSRGTGKTWIYDPITDRKWQSDLETVRSAMNDFNHDLIGGVYGSLNDWYYCLGIKGIRIGDDIGWCADKLLAIRFAAMVLDNGEPAIVLDYETLPNNMYRYGM